MPEVGGSAGARMPKTCHHSIFRPHVLCRSWSPGVSALLDATLDDVLFQPASTYRKLTDEGSDCGTAACRGSNGATPHRDGAADVNRPPSAKASLLGTYEAALAGPRCPQRGWETPDQPTVDRQPESIALSAYATGLSLEAQPCRTTFGFSDPHDSSGDTGLMQLLVENSEQHDLLDQIRDVLQLGVSADQL